MVLNNSNEESLNAEEATECILALAFVQTPGGMVPEYTTISFAFVVSAIFVPSYLLSTHSTYIPSHTFCLFSNLSPLPPSPELNILFLKTKPDIYQTNLPFNSENDENVTVVFFVLVHSQHDNYPDSPSPTYPQSNQY